MEGKLTLEEYLESDLYWDRRGDLAYYYEQEYALSHRCAVRRAEERLMEEWDKYVRG
jgi:hypothetical protein